VLKEGGHFDGIYRKIQIKPMAWDSDGQVKEVLLILKYGGILTPAGEVQAERLGRSLREAMYPTELGTVASSPPNKASNGLLRLHATQRHDFKVYSSDEGRVQMSAAAFTRGLLDLESAALTPICAALVETDPAMLDDVPHNAEVFLRTSKKRLEERITGVDPEPPASPGGSPKLMLRGVSPVCYRLEDLEATVPVMITDLAQLHKHVTAVCRELEVLDLDSTGSMPCGQAEGTETAYCCSMTSPLLVQKRWQKLEGDLWDAKKGTWNTAKVPEIYDAVKFDLIHHARLASEFGPLYDVAKRINDVMVPNEYGHDEGSRIKIGTMVCGQLVRKLLADLRKSTGGAGLNDGEDLPQRKIVTAVQYLKRIFALPKWLMAPKDSAKATAAEDEFREAELAEPDPRHAVGIMCSPNRRVRTRLYFTSESHIQTLMNVLRYCRHTPDKWREQDSGASDEERRVEDGCPRGKGIVCPEAEEALKAEPVFDYLTHVVFRLYEDKRATSGSPERHRVEVLFSPGAAGHPRCCSNHIMELKDLRPLHMPGKALTLAQLQRLLGPFAREISAESGTPKPADGPLLPAS